MTPSSSRSHSFCASLAVIRTVLLAAALFALASCNKQTAGRDGPPPRSVVTAKAFSQDVPLYLDEIGTTSPLETVEVKAQVTGQIIAREFKDGADVKKGD